MMLTILSKLYNCSQRMVKQLMMLTMFSKPYNCSQHFPDAKGTVYAGEMEL